MTTLALSQASPLASGDRSWRREERESIASRCNWWADAFAAVKPADRYACGLFAIDDLAARVSVTSDLAHR